jgi:DNA-binding transcriptional MerR regulator
MRTLVGVYTAGRTAQLTGVPRETLRKWEQRYGVVAPVRTRGNYRLYDDEAVRRLSVMRDLVDAGWAPREAARKVIEQPAGSVTAVPGSETGSPHSALDDLASCAEDFDVSRLESLLDQGFAGADLASAVDDWLMPSLVRLGDAWQRGVVSVAGEHFVSAAVLRRLSQAFHQLPHPSPEAPGVMVGLAHGSRHELGVMAFAAVLRRLSQAFHQLPHPSPEAPGVMVGLAHGSRHELGVMAFAAVLRSRGVAVTYLGADLPVESWIDTVRALSPDAVVLGVPTVEDLPAVREAVQAMSSSTTVLLGGAHQDRIEGAEALGHRIGEAAVGLADRLSSVG